MMKISIFIEGSGHLADIMAIPPRVNEVIYYRPDKGERKHLRVGSVSYSVTEVDHTDSSYAETWEKLEAYVKENGWTFAISENRRIMVYKARCEVLTKEIGVDEL
jgi:hypothetical protein